MATTYMYLNNGKKVPYYADSLPQSYSGPYRNFVTEEEPATTAAKNTATYAQTKNTAATVQTTDSGAAALAEELRKQREAEQAKAAEEARKRKEKLAKINSSKETETKMLAENLQLQKKAAAQTNSDNLRQLYIAYMQGLKGIPQKQALWGAGGEVASLANRTRLNYENNRADENRSYANILDSIQQSYNDDLGRLEEKYLKMLLDL